MYNRYIPEDMSYTQASPQPKRGPEPPQGWHRQPSIRLPELLAGKEGLSGLLKGLRLDKLDSGDILLLLIVLFLLLEGDNLELAIALGLVLIMGLGDDKEQKPDPYGA